jgi:hypothetical protein
MWEILKSIGIASGLASLIVLSITAVPIWYQIESTKSQNARIADLEAKVLILQSDLTKTDR